MARLRRVSPQMKGWTRKRAGKGFAYLDADGNRLPAEEVERIRSLAIPPGLARRVDLPVPQRPHPGPRHRRRRSPPVPLPPRLAHQARPAQVRPGQGRRRPAGPGPRADARGPRRARGCRSSAPPRPPPGCSTWATSGSAATPTPTPTARFGLTTLERRHVRRVKRRPRLQLRRQVGHRALDHDQRPARHRRRSNLMRRRRGGSARLLAYRGEARWADLDASAVNAYISQMVARGPHRQGLPHLARHRARRGRAGREPREGRHQGLAEAGGQGRRRGGRRLPRQHPDHRPQVRTSTRGSSTSTSRRRHDRRRPSPSGTATTAKRQAAIEKAVARLIDNAD